MNQTVDTAGAIICFIKKEAGVRRGIDGGRNPTVFVAPDVYSLLVDHIKQLYRLPSGTDDYGRPLDIPNMSALKIDGLEIKETALLGSGTVVVVPFDNVELMSKTLEVKDGTTKVRETPKPVLQGAEGAHGCIPGGAREDVREEAPATREGQVEGLREDAATDEG